MAKYIVYSFSLIIPWGILLLSVDKPGSLGVFLCLIYTFYSCVLVKNFVEFESTKLKVIKFIGPVIYLLALIFKANYDLYLFLNPILIAFLIFFVSSFVKENYPSITIQLFVVFFCYLYTYSLYPLWEDSILEEKVETYNFTTKIHEEELHEKVNLNIAGLNFLDEANDTFHLYSNKKFIILESWNETCAPCIKAMKDLPDFYYEIKSNADQYYLYEYNDKKYKVDLDAVFNFKFVPDHSKIIIDLNGNLYKRFGLKGYPFFLIFDQEGQLVFKQSGYEPSFKKTLQDTIRKIVL